MIVIEVPLEDVIIAVEKDIDLGTDSKDKAILHLTQTYEFISVSVEKGVAIISPPAKANMVAGQRKS